MIKTNGHVLQEFNFREEDDFHELDTYQYINDKVTLIEKAVDTKGSRKVYQLIGIELILTEVSESQMR